MDRMDPLDAAMVTAEALTPMHVAAVLILSPPDDAGPGYVDDLHRQALAATDPIDPRFRRYPHRGVDTGGVWVWRDARQPRHRPTCKRTTLPPGAGRDELWRLISELHAERLDRSRPMWMAYLIDGLDAGRFALYVKVHHAAMDGVAGFQVIADALSSDPTRRCMPPIYAARTTKRPRGPAGRPAVTQSVHRAAVAAGRGRVERRAGRESRHRRGLQPGRQHDQRHHRRALGAPYTRFNGRPATSVPSRPPACSKTRIRAVQDKAAVTGNDVVVAVIAGALRCWLLDHGELPEQSLVAICPITVRGHEHGGDDEHGNKFGVWLCPLGTDLEDRAERLDLIHRSMSKESIRWPAAGRRHRSCCSRRPHPDDWCCRWCRLRRRCAPDTTFRSRMFRARGPKCIGTAPMSRRSIRWRWSTTAWTQP